jgi:hypothetical protein
MPTFFDLTAPFDPSVRELVTGFHAQDYRVEAFGGPLADPVDLGVIGGRISWDEARTPEVSAELTCALPQDAPTVLDLDPRQGVRARFVVAYTLANGTRDEHEVADLHLRRRVVARPGEQLALSLASDEALVIDSSPNVVVTAGGDPGDPSTVTKTNAAGWIGQVIQEGLWNPGAPGDVDVDFGAGVENLSAEWPVDVPDYWAAIEDVADQLNLDVYDPGDRTFRIAKRPTVAAASSLTIKGGPGGILLDSDSTIEREEWANMVTIRYDWRTPAGVESTLYGTARVTAGPFAADTVGYKILTETRDQATTQAAANIAAATVLGRLLARSRGLSVTVVPCWWVRPRNTVTYYPSSGGDEQRHIVSSVSFDLESMEMDIQTRLPDADSTIGE